MSSFLSPIYRYVVIKKARLGAFSYRLVRQGSQVVVDRIQHFAMKAYRNQRGTLHSSHGRSGTVGLHLDGTKKVEAPVGIIPKEGFGSLQMVEHLSLFCTIPFPLGTEWPTHVHTFSILDRPVSSRPTPSRNSHSPCRQANGPRWRVWASNLHEKRHIIHTTDKPEKCCYSFIKLIRVTNSRIGYWQPWQ
jgi:hypothetical protein